MDFYKHLSQNTQIEIDIEIFDFVKYIDLGPITTGASQLFHHLALFSYIIPLLKVRISFLNIFKMSLLFEWMGKTLLAL
ncbi:hypothetical protein HZS_493 [Henneguya salminicola]|nr:hypothetical protein HZS_493 [Henneguya salminicola]